MKLITVKKAHAQTDLVVLKSRLESEGIECYFKNELTAQVLNYVPAFLVELQVQEKDLLRVQEIMAETNESIQEGKKVACPDCYSQQLRLKLSLLKRIQLVFAILYAAIAMTNVPLDKLFKKPEFKCKNCGQEFID